MLTFKKAATIRVVLLAVLLLAGGLAQSHAQSSGQGSLLYGVSPGVAKAEIRSQLLSLSNQMVEAQWSVREGKLTGLKFVIRGTGAENALPRDPFILILKDGTPVRASEMTFVSGPRIEVLHTDLVASRAAEHSAGRAILVRLQDSARNLSVDWRAILRDGSNYVREEITISALNDDQPITEVRLFDGNVPGASVVGSVKGSPVTAGDLFLGFEDPLAQCQAGATVICGMKRELPLRKGQSVEYSLVIGAAPPGQMRRGFLNYVERERAHPCRTFLHYNTWYDIGFGKPYDAAAVLDVIGAFGTELVRKRGAKLDSFLLDDGWDNPHSTWQMNSGFPGGLAPLNREANAYGAAMGVWLSPWGGYDEAKRERLDFGRKNGFETNEGGFALSGPKYYARFREVSLDFIRDGANQFKIDGTGNVDSVFPGSSFDSDFAAAISLIRDWRAKKPDLYVNLTTGTYPSPFWLRYADSIWRGGDDHSFAGVGTWREKWITYRDSQTYQNIVQAGRLFPLNSLMLHGLIYARQAEHLDSDPGNDFANEVHDYFGTGTQLQEMYISHTLLSKSNWDVLAEAANWSRRNAGILRDTHWVGGDPGKLEVYGWAAWSRTNGILTLRNPSDQRQSIAVDVGRAFELPPGAPHRFVASSPWKQDRGTPPVSLKAGEEHVFTLEPFEVLTLEARPITSGGRARDTRDQ
ncbi:MAG: enterotoxin [Candidatus Sulfotelmatobacter sp.]